MRRAGRGTDHSFLSLNGFIGHSSTIRFRWSPFYILRLISQYQWRIRVLKKEGARLHNIFKLTEFSLSFTFNFFFVKKGRGVGRPPPLKIRHWPLNVQQLPPSIKKEVIRKGSNHHFCDYKSDPDRPTTILAVPCDRHACETYSF